MIADSRQIKCKSFTEPEAFKPEAFEKPSKN